MCEVRDPHDAAMPAGWCALVPGGGGGGDILARGDMRVRGDTLSDLVARGRGGAPVWSGLLRARAARRRSCAPPVPVMVDWAPSNRVALSQQLSVLTPASLHDEAGYRRSAAVLKTLVQKLRHDDTVTYTYRRQLLHANIIRTNLVPLLLHEDPPFQVQHLTIVLLDMLSAPEESLRPSPTALSGLSPEVSIQLSLGLRALKEELSSPMAARAVLTPLRGVLARQPAAGDVTTADSECVSATLSLLRNLLHGPLSSDAGEVARYRNLLWALLSADLAPALHQLMRSPSLALWCVPVVELLAQLYKMYAGGHLHKTLQNWLNPSPSDSSEDDESNTSPPDPGVDGRTDPAPATTRGVWTVMPPPPEAMPTGAAPGTTAAAAAAAAAAASKARRSGDAMAESLKRKLTTVRAQERLAEPNLSTSSSDEGPNVKRATKSAHFKPHRTPKPKPSPAAAAAAAGVTCTGTCGGGVEPPTPQPTPPPQTLEPGVRLLRSIRARAHKILSLVPRDPSQGDLDIVLVEFTIQFLLAGWGQLVQALMASLPEKMDKSHLYWVIVYFMKPCTEIRVSYPNIQPVLCSELVMLLTYEATRLVGIGASQPSSTLERFHSQRQLHMLTNAIREILYGLEAVRAYSSDEHVTQIRDTLCQVGGLRQFRQLPVLLIGQCRLGPASLPYLRDLVLTNHLLISSQETVGPPFPLIDHVELFAEPTIIRRYTSLLKLYATNPPVLNDALFTVLHHVVGDANRIELLFQPAVLKTFSEILGSDLPLLQDWLDLIEYTIQRFIERQHDPDVRAALQTDAAAELASTLGGGGGAASQLEPPVGQSLHQLAASAGGRAEVFAAICRQLQTELGQPVSPRWALQRLAQLQLLPAAQCQELAMLLGDRTQLKPEPPPPGREADLSDPDTCRRALEHPSVEFLLDCVRRDAEVGASSLAWLQCELLEVCAARLSTAAPAPSAGPAPPPEPVALFSQRRGRACPLVPMTRHQVRAVNAPCFLRLLRALRIQTPTPDHVYPLVPLALPATYLFAAAQKVAPLEPGSLKFDPADLTRPEVPAEMAAQTEEMTDVSHELLPPPPPPPPSLTPLRSSNWMALVSRQKAGFPQLLQPPVMSRGGSGGQLTPPDSGGGDVSMDEDDPYGPVTSSC